MSGTFTTAARGATGVAWAPPFSAPGSRGFHHVIERSFQGAPACNKRLEFIDWWNTSPGAYDRSRWAAQVYNPPQQRRPADNARPVRQQGGYAGGGYSQGGYNQGQYAQGASNVRDYDRYAGRAP